MDFSALTASAAVFAEFFRVVFAVPVSNTMTWLLERLSFTDSRRPIPEPIAVPSSTSPIFTAQVFQEPS